MAAFAASRLEAAERVIEAVRACARAGLCGKDPEAAWAHVIGITAAYDALTTKETP